MRFLQNFVENSRLFPRIFWYFSDIGGIAGGAKYRVQNIFFKFALDTLINISPPLYMYGGSSPNHRSAAKAAKNEMKGLEYHSSCYVRGLCYPMMACVDYKGFTVLCMAVLPIDKVTSRVQFLPRHLHFFHFSSTVLFVCSFSRSLISSHLCIFGMIF